MSDNGLILVFDLDQTLVDTNSMFKITNSPTSHTEFYKQAHRLDVLDKNIISHLNMKLIDTVLKPAFENKNKGKNTVSAILLLSNNSNDTYIRKVLAAINVYLNLSPDVIVFDNVFSRRRDNKNSISEDPPKSLKDVNQMMVKGNNKDLKNRVYFFDDHSDHNISKEIPPEHYFTITIDTTDYSTVISAINDIYIPPSRSRSRSRSRSHGGGLTTIRKRNRRSTKRLRRVRR